MKLISIPNYFSRQKFSQICLLKSGRTPFLLCLSLSLLLAAPVQAEEGEHEAQETRAELVTLSPEAALEMKVSLESIQLNIEAVRNLEQSLTTKEGLIREVLQRRLDKLWSDTLDSAVLFADDVANKRDQGLDVTEYYADVSEFLESLPAAIQSASARIRTQVVLPDASLPAAEQVARDEEFFAAVTAYNNTNIVLERSIDIAHRFDLDVSDEYAYLRIRLTEIAANTSIYLDMAQSEVGQLRATISVLPEDTEIAARLKIAESRVLRIAASLETNLALMDRLNISTSHYRQQLLAATGQISAGTIDAEVVSRVLSTWGESVIENIKAKGPSFLFQVGLFVAILLVFFKLADWSQQVANRAMDSSGVRMSRLLRRMVSSLSRNVVIVIGVLIALSQVGISLGPVLTGLGIAGFIIGFALQDSLSNFASGMLILVYRPFDLGDTVEVAGISGTVSHMSLVNTTVLTFDNQTLIVPNNKIWQDVIKNLTEQHTRRIDLTFGITYDQDIDEAERVLREVVLADDRVLENPELNIRVHEFADSSVNLIVRPWVKTGDYWEVFWDLNKAIKQRLDAEGISIPFPQRDVHLFAAEPEVQNSVMPQAKENVEDKPRRNSSGAAGDDPLADESAG